MLRECSEAEHACDNCNIPADDSSLDESDTVGEVVNKQAICFESKENREQRSASGRGYGR